LDKSPILEISFNEHLKKADKAIEGGIEVPLPKDPGGGYTAAGIAYSITGDTAYATFVTDMLLGYATMYPNLPLHPKRKENHPAGKLFWQGLNESVWLVNSIQAYNLVSDAISEENKTIIEDNVFKKVAEFISVLGSSGCRYDRIRSQRSRYGRPCSVRK